jgi:hypothetical protein
MSRAKTKRAGRRGVLLPMLLVVGDVQQIKAAVPRACNSITSDLSPGRPQPSLVTS